jgi:hypothetical protein
VALQGWDQSILAAPLYSNLPAIKNEISGNNIIAITAVIKGCNFAPAI